MFSLSCFFIVSDGFYGTCFASTYTTTYVLDCTYVHINMWLYDKSFSIVILHYKHRKNRKNCMNESTEEWNYKLLKLPLNECFGFQDSQRFSSQYAIYGFYDGTEINGKNIWLHIFVQVMLNCELKYGQNLWSQLYIHSIIRPQHKLV